jgi:O-antigen ligase
LGCMFVGAEFLDTPEKRRRLLDLLFVTAGSRAVLSVVRYFFAEGDPNNGAAGIGLKVAMWESANHLIFGLLIAVAVAALLTQAESLRRRLLWTAAAVPMVVTTVFSFRRTGWLGLAITLTVLGLLLLRNRGWTVLGGTAALLGGIASISYSRFKGTGLPLIERLFPDVQGTYSEATRPLELSLGWQTIRQDVWFGGGLTAERAGGYFSYTAQFVHNTFLHLWMQRGAIGLTAFCVLLALVLARLAQFGWRNTAERHLVAALLALWGYVLLEFLTGTPLIEVRHAAIMGLIMGLMVAVSGTRESAG